MAKKQKAAPKVDHARQNAAAWADTIAQMVAALECDFGELKSLRNDRDGYDSDDHAGKAWAEVFPDDAAKLEELEEAATIDGAKMEDADAVRERITESPLSVQVRSGWITPSDEMQAEDFEVLLSTGGPALRIVGELDQYKQPRHAWMEFQDWGTAWTEFHGEGAPAQSDLLTFCQQFYFGE